LVANHRMRALYDSSVMSAIGTIALSCDWRRHLTPGAEEFVANKAPLLVERMRGQCFVLRLPLHPLSGACSVVVVKVVNAVVVVGG